MRMLDFADGAEFTDAHDRFAPPSIDRLEDAIASRLHEDDYTIEPKNRRVDRAWAVRRFDDGETCWPRAV